MCKPRKLMLNRINKPIHRVRCVIWVSSVKQYLWWGALAPHFMAFSVQCQCDNLNNYIKLTLYWEGHNMWCKGPPPQIQLHWADLNYTSHSIYEFIDAIKHLVCSITLSGWILDFNSAPPQFWTVPFSHQSIPHHSPDVSIPDTTSHVQPANFFYLIWRELLWAATSAREALKHSEMVCLLCKFHSRAHNPWLVIIFKIDYLLTSNVWFNLERFP